MGENKANGRSADHGAEKLATWSDNKDGGSLTNEDPCKNTIKKIKQRSDQSSTSDEETRVEVS